MIGAPSTNRKVIFGLLVPPAPGVVEPALRTAISYIDVPAVGHRIMTGVKPVTVENSNGVLGELVVPFVHEIKMTMLSVLFHSNSFETAPFKGVVGAVPNMNVSNLFVTGV